MKALIFNSGTGSRMGELTKNSPKSFVHINPFETIFERQIRVLGECGITEFIITTGLYHDLFVEVIKKYPQYHFTLVKNPLFDTTNYIYSFYLCKEYLDDDFLVLHGDLVFDKRFVIALLKNYDRDLVAINKAKALPDKDFKGRLNNENILQEVSINIFDSDCFCLQPFYKLSQETINKWMNEIIKFVKKKNVKVYAENALNNILKDIEIRAFYYHEYYVEEVDTPEDLARVTPEIKIADYAQQEIFDQSGAKNKLKMVLKQNKVTRPFFVIDKAYPFLSIKEYIDSLKLKKAIYFDAFSPNPKYEEVLDALEVFKSNKCDFIIAIGGGSCLDVAKSIKGFAPLKENYLTSVIGPSPIKLLAIPTTAGTGSESTHFSVFYVQGEKYSLDSDYILPEYVILDSTLLRTLPRTQKFATMLDALCQATESYYACGSNETSEQYALKAIKMILSNYKNYLFGYEEKAAKNIMLGASLAGRAINISKTTAAHAMSYKLTSKFNIPHGLAVSLCLPHVFDFMKNHLDQVRNGISKRTLQAKFHKLEQLYSRLTGQSVKDFIEDLTRMVIPDKGVANDHITLLELTKSVNVDRLSNNPIQLNEEDLLNLYAIILN